MAESQFLEMEDQCSNDAVFVDIGANLSDPMYIGNYRGKQRHDPDLDKVLERAWANRLDRIILTGGTLAESKKCWELTKTDHRLFCTVGVHPTRCGQEFGDSEESWEQYLSDMRNFIKETSGDGSVVALGELGLDYARFEFCDKETQQRGLIAQLQVSEYVLFHWMCNKITACLIISNAKFVIIFHRYQLDCQRIQSSSLLTQQRNRN